MQQWSSTIKFNGDQFEISITSSGSVQAGNIMPHIQTVKLCPNVVCWFYSKNGLSRACSKKIFKDLVEGVCFETVFNTSCKALIILSKPLYNQTPRPEGIK